MKRVSATKFEVLDTAQGGRTRRTFRPSWLFLVCALALAGELVTLAALNLESIVEMIPDDSFFYLVIARNFPQTLDFSFDGVNPTYGFQPLWQICLLPLGALVRSSEHLLYLTLAVCSLLHVVSASRLYRLLESLSGRLAGACGLAFWLLNPAILRWFWGIKENGLYACLFLVVLARVLGWIRQSGSTRDALRLGGLLGLTVLTRVNFALICVPAALLSLCARTHVLGKLPNRRDMRFLAMSMLAGALLALPWFAWSWSHFGTLLPTSGLVKFESARIAAENQGVEWLSPQYLLLSLKKLPEYIDQSFKLGAGPWGPILLGLAGWQAIETIIRRVRSGTWRALVSDRAASWVVLLLGVVAVLNSLITIVALPDFLAYGQWYTVPEYLAQAVLFGLFAASALSALRSGWIVRLSIIGVLALSCALWSTQRARGIDFSLLARGPVEGGQHPNQMLLKIGRWAREHFEEGERVGIWDPGIITYFSEVGLISLDPLMNSYPYIQDQRHDQLGYIASQGISYVFGPAAVRKDGYEFLRLPEGSYEVVWVPFPDEDLGWSSGETWRYVLVRPEGAVGQDFLTADDFGFGDYLGGVSQ